MSTLVGYGSSDEDNENDPIPRHAEACPTDAAQDQTLLTDSTFDASNSAASSSLSQSVGPEPPSTARGPLYADGPSLGPTAPTTGSSISASPNSPKRAMIQELTLPIYANLNIPPSPPHSSYPGLDQKISHFLSLKRQGIHFNAKLGTSSALKNPSLLAKMLESAGLDYEGAQDQYGSTLPRALWDPHEFSADVYKAGLARMQRDAERKIGREVKGAEREFVTAKDPEHG